MDRGCTDALANDIIASSFLHGNIEVQWTMVDSGRSRRSAERNDQIYVDASGGPFCVYPERWEFVPRGERPIYAIHHMLELGIVLSGRLRLHYSRWMTDLGPGEIWLTGLWERHARVPLRKPSEAVTLMVLPAVLMQMNWAGDPPTDWTLPFKVAPEHRPTASNDDRATFRELGRELIGRQDDRQDPDRGLWLRLAMLRALLTLRKGWQPPASTRPFLNPDYGTLTAVVELVTSSNGLIRSKDVARQIGLSRNAFARYFSDFTGLSFPEFCVRHRLSRAADQLLETADSVKCVAHDWGFAHASHLHRLFLRYYGCSPGHYRRHATGHAADDTAGRSQTRRRTPAETKQR